MFIPKRGIAVGISCSIQDVEDIMYGNTLNVLHKSYFISVLLS